VIGHRRQRRAKAAGQADSADDDLAERLVDNRVAVHPIEPVSVAADDAARLQQRKFAMDRSDAATRAPDDLAEVERFVRPPK
jgi:hypothetical protein